MSNIQNHDSIKPNTYICNMLQAANPNSSGRRILFLLTAPIVFTEVLFGQPAKKGSTTLV